MTAKKKHAKRLPRELAPKKLGRLPLDIDPKVIEAMATYGATNEELAHYHGCSTDTIENHFSGLLVKARANLNIRLRRTQITEALKGNTSMLIWLGKQRLKQSDKVETPVDEQGNEIPRQRIRVGKDWIEF